MTPEQLKASILQYAIQGKLVEQRPEEGTAEELYQKIQKEKQKLIKEGRIKKEKPIAEITEEEIPFDIPESWKWVRLGECGCFERGNGIKKDEVTPDGYPCVRYGQLYTTYKTRFDCAVSHVSKNTFDKCKKVHKNDVLMALTGENEYDIALAVVYEGDEELAMGGDMTKFFNHCMNPLYLIYVINSHYGIGCKSKMASGNIIVHISNDKLASIPIPLPPLKEQHRIVAKIEKLLPYVDRYAAAYEKLEQFNAKFPEDMKKSILQYAIQGKLVEQRPEEGTAEELYQKIQKEKQKLIKEGKIKKEKPLAEITEDEMPFEIPESWKWVRVSEIMTLENGDRSKKYPVESDYVEFGIPFFGAKDIVNGKMSFDDVRYISQEKYDELGNGKLVNRDLICLLRGSVGKTALFMADKKHKTGFICAQMLIIRAINTELIPYLLQYFLSPLYLSLVETKTTGTAVRQLPAKEIAEMLIPLPPIKEQRRIVAKIEELLPYCDRLVKE